MPIYMNPYEIQSKLQLIMKLGFSIFCLVVFYVESLPPFSELEGFGAEMNIKILNEVVVKDQISFKVNVKPYTYIKLYQNSTINLKEVIWLKQVNDIIIEGPATLLNHGIEIKNSSRIILHNIRILNASIYGVLVYGSNNIVLNSLTILDASRGSIDQGKCVDVTEGSQNVTISKSIFGYRQFSSTDKYKGMLIANFLHAPVTNLSLHHNIFYQNYQRSPQISTQGLFDMRNNFVYGFTQYGSRIRQKAYGNFISNFYIGGKKDPLVFLNQSAINSFSRNNSWKFNYESWEPIAQLGQQIYKTPKVTTTNSYQQLIKQIDGWGCIPSSQIEKQIRNKLYAKTIPYQQSKNKIQYISH